jgi:4'-phosphopantetheinyl transferase
MFEKIHLDIRRILSCGDSYEYVNAMLSPLEIERATLFQKSSDSAGFRLGRYLVRRQLAKILKCSSQNVPIEISVTGKPFCPIENLPQFSISHCHNLVVVGWFKNSIGVDVESFDSLHNVVGIENILLHPNEKRMLSHYNPDDYRRKILEKFILKEAFLKLDGSGLIIEPSSIEVIDKVDGGIEVKYSNIKKSCLQLYTLRDKWIISTAVYK